MTMDWVAVMVEAGFVAAGLWYSWPRRSRIRFAFLLSVSLAGVYHASDNLGVLIVNEIDFSVDYTFLELLFWGTFVISVLSSIAALLVFISAAWKLSVWLNANHKFYRVFEVRRPRNEVEKTFLRSIVDAKLRWLALFLHRLYDVERKLLGDVSHDSETSDRKERELSELRKLVAIAKQKFWSAHNMARDMGFEVKGSYKDYLDPQVFDGSGKSPGNRRRTPGTTPSSSAERKETV